MVKPYMKSQTQHVLQRLFSESSMDNIPVEKLRQLVDEYPYFTLGHLLLAQKLQTINAAQYEAQSEMTCLYFNEPIWLQSLLHPSDEKSAAIQLCFDLLRSWKTNGQYSRNGSRTQ